MHLSTLRSLLFALAISMNTAQVSCDESPFPYEAFNLCKEDACSECPVHIGTTGPKYPDCVIYNSEDVFTNQGFPKQPESGEYEAWIDINMPERSPYQIIIKSPAATSFPGCGATLHTIKTSQCAKIHLKESFMVQWCNGNDECVEAGASKRSAKWGHDFTMKAAGGGGGMLSLKMLGPNGTAISPKEIGPPPPPVVQMETADPRGAGLQDRSNGVCNGTWKADPSWEDYTKPADHPKIVATHVRGPSDVDITESRSVAFTMSMELGFADIISLGLGFEVTETMEESTSRKFTVGEGEEGDVAFTGFLRCTKGIGNCNGKDIHGEVCTPYKDNGGNLAGLYHVVGRS